MDELSKVLKVLLKRMPYELLIRNKLDCMALEKNILNKAVHMYMPVHSDTEVQNMLESLGDFLDKYAEFLGHGGTGEKSVSVFDAVFRFSDGMLIKMNNEVMCRYESLLRWRMTTTDVSEEIFVTAYLARRDLKEGVYCKDFTWPTVIGHNNMQLRNLMRFGLAENHFHLWGSSPYFHLAWLRMMNDIIEVETGKEPDIMDSNLRTGYMVYDKKYPEKDMKSCCLRAALIRVFIFSEISDITIKLGEYYIDWKYLMPWILKFSGCVEKKIVDEKLRNTASCSVAEALELIFRTKYKENDPEWVEFKKCLPALQKILNKKSRLNIQNIKCVGDEISVRDILCFLFREQQQFRLQDCRVFFSKKEFLKLWREMTYKRAIYYLNNYEAFVRHIDQVQNAIDSITIEHKEKVVDYALTAVRFAGYHESDVNDVLGGERCFLYEMFRRIDSRDRRLPPHIYNLFYAYLIMKEKIRGEMIQSNRWVGFENFSIYQKRTGYFSGGQYLSKLKAKMAVQSCMEQNVRLLEIRISFGNSVKEIYEDIDFLDKAIDPDGKWKETFFYVLHFIKDSDDGLEKGKYCECRHYALRRVCERKTRALLEFRRRCPETAKRVLGIDAANQEIGCRPEVFSQPFRALRNDTCIVYSADGFVKLPQLRTTYHVGEDFLDVVDGLRAIDEAVLFLNLDCGDRIGHGLALGISVKEWYRVRNRHISLPKQDYLDNIVWLYHAITRYKIYCLDNLKNDIEQEFWKYFSDIYGKAMNQDYINKVQKSSEQKEYRGIPVFDIHAYYNAWKLRGDAPELYKRGHFHRNQGYAAPYEVEAVNNKYPSDFNLRCRPEVALLYHLYHYDVDVRLSGREKIDIKVSEDYVKGTELVQKAMQREITARGIAIESNPSSNYMIGNFGRYEDHPIINFYNNGLTVDSKQLTSCPQIQVSINTDDQGIFDTKLENEYALLALALEKKKDENGEPVYQKTMIYEWLDKIRRMGFSQSFGNHISCDFCDESEQTRGFLRNVQKKEK